jgi:hypothetical protein
MSCVQVTSSIENVLPGVYTALWHIQLSPDMDFGDIYSFISCEPRVAAIPIGTPVPCPAPCLSLSELLRYDVPVTRSDVTKRTEQSVITRTAQNVCKTGKWCHVIVAEKLYVAEE